MNNSIKKEVAPYDNSNYDNKRFNRMPEVVGVDKFKTFPEVKEIYPKVYLYENFMGKDFAKFITDVCNFYDDKDYYGEHFSYLPEDFSEDDMDLNGKIITVITQHKFADLLLLDMRNLVSPQYSIFYYSEFLRLKTGESSIAKIFKENVMHPDYKVAYFCGDFTGGEVNFKNQFVYPVKKDDLIIFDASYLTSVNEVRSGTRYAYINYLYKDPGVLMI